MSPTRSTGAAVPRGFLRLVGSLCLGIVLMGARDASAQHLTALNFGDARSEAEYKVAVERAAVVPGSAAMSTTAATMPAALVETGRRIAPGKDEPPGWIEFDARVDPNSENYLTLRIWGGDETFGPLGLLRADGLVDLGDLWWLETKERPFPGRWVYRTCIIPREVTSGLTTVRLRLQAKAPTFAVYDLYTHTAPFFEPPASDEQGKPFAWGPPREKPADFPSIEQRLRERALGDIKYTMGQNVVRTDYGAAHRVALRMLATLPMIYHREWSGFHRDESIMTRVRDTIDLHVRRQAKQGGDAGAMFYRGWQAHGLIALAYHRSHDEFVRRGWLDEPVDHDDDPATAAVARREAYADFFTDAFDYRWSDRRHYTNQPVHISRGLYAMQKALRCLDPKRAMTEAQALWYVHEAMGIEPLRSREFGIDAEAAGFPYYTVTEKGLTRELGYVDGYGELTDAILMLVEETGDPRVKEKARQFIAARSYFRIPTNDADGHRALRGIGFLSWRRPNYPYMVRYNGIHEAAVLEEPAAVRLAQLEIEHGRTYLLGPAVARHVHWDPAETIHEYERYLKVMAMPPTRHRLPMEPGRPDFVWADEENGTYTFRHGEAQVYGSFYYIHNVGGRGINSTGPISFTTPTVDRVVDVRFEAFSPPSGLFVTVNHPFGARKYEQSPPPPGMTAWQELPPNAIDRRAGLAYFYRLRFGDYLVAMNTTGRGTYRESTYTLEIPQGVSAATDVHTGKSIDLTQPVRIGPRSTVVLHLGKERK